jgi:hypothetical protein
VASDMPKREVRKKSGFILGNATNPSQVRECAILDCIGRWNESQVEAEYRALSLIDRQAWIVRMFRQHSTGPFAAYDSCNAAEDFFDALGSRGLEKVIEVS